MSELKLEKAKLVELNEDLSSELPGGKEVIVQFNPDSLKVTYANQVVQPEGGDQAAGTAGRQFVGAGTTKLALTLWFDVTTMTEDPVDDVRRKTVDVIHFMTPKESSQDASKLAPPGTRFLWGSFKFDGMVEGLEETLEFFSSEGKPLRASISLTLSQQKILVSTFDKANSAKSRPGQRPFQSAKQGDSVQNMAGGAGKGGDWQSIASANGIEDPLRLAPGQMLDLNVGIGTPSSIGGANAGIGISGNIGVTAKREGGVQTPALPRFGLN